MSDFLEEMAKDYALGIDGRMPVVFIEGAGI